MRLRPLQRGIDGLAKHEVTAHQPHRLPRGGTDRWRAEPFGELPDGSLWRFSGLDHLCREPECPGGGVDEKALDRVS